MIKFIQIDNFKSLVNFDLKLAEFTCLVGLNGSGKSTVLQAMDFLSQLMDGDLDGWLERRHWDRSDLNSKLTKKNNITFKVVVELPALGEVVWSGSVNRTTLRCTEELVSKATLNLLRVDDGRCSIGKVGSIEDITAEEFFSPERFPIVFEYQGSILSQLKNSQTNEFLHELKEAVLGIRSLDLLSPELLRSRTKESKGKLGLGGERLSAFIHEAGSEGKSKLKEELAAVYPQLNQIETRSLRSGWKQLEITEQFEGQLLKSTARHMNDGMLRMMAIVSQLEGNNEFLIFDEIENGINPELVEYLVDHLVQSSHQVLVTTHSPMILNFMEDDVATDGVVYLYKNNEGITKSIKLFSIPSMAKKLAFMGPGEAFVDTDMTLLYQEIETLNIQQ